MRRLNVVYLYVHLRSLVSGGARIAKAVGWGSAHEEEGGRGEHEHAPRPCPQRYRWHLEKNATQMAAISWQLTGRREERRLREVVEHAEEQAAVQAQPADRPPGQQRPLPPRLC